MSDIKDALAENPYSSGVNSVGNLATIPAALGQSDAALPEREEEQEDDLLLIDASNPYAQNYAPPTIPPLEARPFVKTEFIHQDNTVTKIPQTTSTVNFQGEQSVRIVIDPAKQGPIDLENTSIRFNVLMEEAPPQIAALSEGAKATTRMTRELIYQNFRRLASEHFGLVFSTDKDTSVVPQIVAAKMSAISSSSVYGLCSLSGTLPLIRRAHCSIGTSTNAETREFVHENFATQTMLKDMEVINDTVKTVGAKFSYSPHYPRDVQSVKFRETVNNVEAIIDMYPSRLPMATEAQHVYMSAGINSALFSATPSVMVSRAAASGTVVAIDNSTECIVSRIMEHIHKLPVTKSHYQLTRATRSSTYDAASVSGVGNSAGYEDNKQIGLVPMDPDVPAATFQIPIKALNFSFFQNSSIWVGPAITLDLTFKTANTFYADSIVPRTPILHAASQNFANSAKVLPKHMGCPNPYVQINNLELKLTAQVLPPEMVNMIKIQMESGQFAAPISLSVRNDIPLPLESYNTKDPTGKINNMPPQAKPAFFTTRQRYAIEMSGEPSDLFFIFLRPGFQNAQLRDDTVGMNELVHSTGSPFLVYFLPQWTPTTSGLHPKTSTRKTSRDPSTCSST